MDESFSTEWLHHVLSTQSPADELLGCLRLSVVVTSAALNMDVPISVLVPAFSLLGYGPKTAGILGSVLWGQEKFTWRGGWRVCQSRWRDLCVWVSSGCLDPAGSGQGGEWWGERGGRCEGSCNHTVRWTPQPLKDQGPGAAPADQGLVDGLAAVGRLRKKESAGGGAEWGY